MSGTESAGEETGYESNDSSTALHSPDSTPPDIFSSLSADALEPPPGLTFESLQVLNDQSYGLHPFCGKLRARLFTRRNAIRWNHISSPWFQRQLPHYCILSGERKLQMAANFNDVARVQSLLKLGVDPCSSDDRKRTALHFAACKGYAETVKLLLEHGADPNQKDVIGNTPLHLAASTNRIAVVTSLLRAGADVSSLDSWGRTPLQLAQSRLLLLQRDKSFSSQQLKDEVSQVTEMLQAYLHRSGMNTEAELLTAFQKQMNLTQSDEEVDNGVKDLLSRLSGLTINQPATSRAATVT